MSRLNFQLKKYEKAVRHIAAQKGLERVEVIPNKGSVVRFELFEIGEKIPKCMWVIHHSHDRKQEIWSPEDYKKAARNLCCEYQEFLDVIKSM